MLSVLAFSGCSLGMNPSERRFRLAAALAMEAAVAAALAAEFCK